MRGIHRTGDVGTKADTAYDEGVPVVATCNVVLPLAGGADAMNENEYSVPQSSVGNEADGVSRVPMPPRLPHRPPPYPRPRRRARARTPVAAQRLPARTATRIDATITQRARARSRRTRVALALALAARARASRSALAARV